VRLELPPLSGAISAVTRLSTSLDWLRTFHRRYLGPSRWNRLGAVVSAGLNGLQDVTSLEAGLGPSRARRCSVERPNASEAVAPITSLAITFSDRGGIRLAQAQPGDGHLCKADGRCTGLGSTENECGCIRKIGPKRAGFDLVSR